MLSNIKTDRLLDDYFHGLITPEQLAEALEVSNRVADNLANEHVIAISAVQHYNLLQQVQQVHNQYSGSRQKEQTISRPVVSMKMLIRIAAVFVLVLSSWLAYEYSTNSYSRLYADMFSGYAVNEVRSAQVEQTNKLLEAYRGGQYKTATEEFIAVAEPTSRDLFFAALSYMGLGNPSAAVPLFHRIYSYNQVNGERLYEDETDYYLALAWLKLNEKKKALQLFEKIAADKEHTYNKSISSGTILKIKWFGHQ